MIMPSAVMPAVVCSMEASVGTATITTVRSGWSVRGVPVLAFLARKLRLMVSCEEVENLQVAIDGYARFNALVQQYVDEIVRLT